MPAKGKKFPKSTKTTSYEIAPFSAKVLPSNNGKSGLGKMLSAMKHPGRPQEGGSGGPMKKY